MSLKGTAAITGCAELKPTKGPVGKTPAELTVQVAKRAIEDAGLMKDEIDGLLIPHSLWDLSILVPHVLAEYMKLKVNYADTMDLGGACGTAMVWRAAAAIQAGLCKNVLCVCADSLDVGRFYARPPSVGPIWAEFERPYCDMPANCGYALVAQRHKHEYGTTDEQRAMVAVKQRQNAMLCPEAIFHNQPITMEDVLCSPVIADPLHRLEIVMPVSGGVAYVVTSADRAKDGPHRPVYLLGAGEYITHNTLAHAPSITTSAIKVSAEQAFQMAGLKPEDIQLACLYDCYTIAVIISLEDAGFCPKGEGGRFVETLDMSHKSKQLAVNVNGGELSFGQAGHSGGMSHVAEAVIQLRGEAGERQVPKCELAFVNGNGGILSNETSLVLGRSR